jgi:hypothetical protein
MLALPDELLIQVVTCLDERILARPISVCRRSTEVGKDVLCAEELPGEWLRAVGTKRYASMVRPVTLARPVDLEIDCTSPNASRLSVALSLLKATTFGTSCICSAFATYSTMTHGLALLLDRCFCQHGEPSYSAITPSSVLPRFEYCAVSTTAVPCCRLPLSKVPRRDLSWGPSHTSPP